MQMYFYRSSLLRCLPKKPHNSLIIQKITHQIALNRVTPISQKKGIYTFSERIPGINQ